MAKRKTVDEPRALPELMTMAELAEALHRSVDTLRYWRWIHYGPPGHKVGGRIMYRSSDVRDWLDEQLRAG